jgi:hypothetical protein
MFLMDDDERDFLANLAPTLTIYRGYTDPGGEDGLSWSLNQEVARSYAMTWAKRQLCDERIRSKALYLASVEVPRDRLICYWCRDDEVIVPTLCGVETRTERIGECRTDHAGTLQLYDAHGHLQPP